MLRSVGITRPLRRGLDLAQTGAVEQVVASRSHRGEIILFTSDANMPGWAFHFVLTLRRVGYEHWLLLADADATCDALHERWRPMETQHTEAPLSCAWSSYPASHPGWQKWQPGVPKVFKLWASRWWVAHQLLRQGVSVLSLDTDAALFSDVYPLLHAPPLGAHDVLISKNGDASGSLNCGFVYFNLHARGGGGGGGGRGGGDAEPCGQHRCATCVSGHVEAVGSEAAGSEVATAGSGRVVPAAEWAALLLWERFALFLGVDRASLRRPPSSQVREGAVEHGQCAPPVHGTPMPSACPPSTRCMGTCMP